MQAFSESLNYAGRVALVQSAFDNPGYTEANLKGLMSSPDHIDEYNLVVVSPEGEHVACTAWACTTVRHSMSATSNRWERMLRIEGGDLPQP